MNEKRAGIILLSRYDDVIDEMSLEDAGALLKAVYAYHSEREIPEMSPLVHAIFLLISADMRSHAERYTRACERNRTNAKKRWEKRPAADAEDVCDRMQSDPAACAGMESHASACEKYQGEEEVEAEAEGERNIYISRASAASAPGASASSAASGNVYPLMTGTERARFEKFWAAYPRRESRARAEAAWREIGPDDALTAQILAAVEAARAADPRFQTQQYTPHPANWLLRREWENEYDDQKNAEVDYGSWTTD